MKKRGGGDGRGLDQSGGTKTLSSTPEDFLGEKG